MGALEGRTIAITGAGSGIGKALAEGFLRDGARVVATDIRERGLESLEGDGALVQITDVTDDAAVRAMVARALDETGRLDALFNNAGIGSRTRVEDLAPDEFERMLRIHLFGTVYGMRAAIPVMRAQGHGRIVNTLSRGAESAQPGNAAYGAAKAGLYALTRSAAEEVADTDILINGLIPGPTNTGIWGRDMPQLQKPEVVYPTARFLATLPAGGPNGRVFWNEKEYTLFHPDNVLPTRGRAR